MKLSRESRYGLSGLAYLARQPAGTILQAGEVAEAAGLPPLFLSKIFGRLTRYGLLRSYRGRDRGYALARPADEISVREVLEAIEGPDVFQRCVFWSDTCSELDPCPLHDTWRTVRPMVADLLDRVSLDQVADTSTANDRSAGGFA